jgi:HD-GYP domain-containing protein (c-di-GMP phosphodiesterase class II)
MVIDSYEAPDAESLLVLGRERHSESNQVQAHRLLITEGTTAALFIAGAASLATLGHPTRSFSVAAFLLAVVTYVLAERVRYPVGSAWTAPTQLVFVPMLFILPTPLVPLIVAACSVADRLPQMFTRRLSLTRVLARIGDSFYALGPAFVLALFDGQTFSWERWPLLLLAFTAQVALDAGAGVARTWFAEGIAPSAHLPMLWLYLTDACLSCIGLMIAASAAARPALLAVAMPLVGLLWLLARERQQRLDYSVALSTAYRGTAVVLGDVVEADDEYTGMHSRDVVELSRSTAELLGLDSVQCRAVEFAALLHDVGKICVPKAILNKPGKLDATEREIIRRHTIKGEELLKPVGGMLASVGRFVRASHEHYDGSGYPDGLAGEWIPIQSRIVSVCDAYSAMTTNRVYRAGMASDEALQELRRCAGTQFDPQVVQALERVVTGRYERCDGHPHLARKHGGASRRPVTTLLRSRRRR